LGRGGAFARNVTHEPTSMMQILRPFAMSNTSNVKRNAREVVEMEIEEEDDEGY
jgi:hypothetical protein